MTGLYFHSPQFFCNEMLWNTVLFLVVCNNNGALDNGETGLDCGGGGCSTCGRFQNKYPHYHCHNHHYELFFTKIKNVALFKFF